jgi:hypothetical protein
MEFCRHCRNEIKPNQKFCDQCGAPVKNIYTPPAGDEPAPPAPQVPPLAKPARIDPGLVSDIFPEKDESRQPAPRPAAGRMDTYSSRSNLPFIAFALIIMGALVLIAVSILISVPGSTLAAYLWPPTPVPTPAPTPVPTTATPEPTPIPTTVLAVEDRYRETYEVIYSKERSFLYGEKEKFPHTLTKPPLFIAFNVTPAMVNETKIAGIGTSSEHVVYAVYPDPHAWYEVRVLDAATGDAIDAYGFGAGKGYSTQGNQEFMVRKGGDYVIEMSGNGVDVKTQIRIGTS